MNFFKAIKSAEYAAKISTAAGFDFSAALASGDENALKDFIAAAVVAGNKPNTEAANQIAELNAALEGAKADNDRLNAALSGIGFKAKDGEDLKTQLDAHIKIRAQGVLAQSGHPAVAAAPDSGGAKVLSRQAFIALNDKERASFIKNGGRLSD